MNETEMAAGLAETANYRYADVVGDQLFVAGQVPHDADGNLVGRDDPGRQAEQCLDNLMMLLPIHGFEVGDLRQLTVYVVGEHQNLTDSWAAVARWFDQDVPPATLLGVNLLGYRDQLVEIDAVVVRNSENSSKNP